MNEVFKVILSLSCSGALLIVLLRLLRPLIRTRLSRRWQYYIWLVVVARLILPFTLEANLIGTLYEQIDDVFFQTESALTAGQNGGFGQPAASDPADAPANQTQGQTAESERPPVSHETNSAVQASVKAAAAVLLQNLWLIWLIIALVLFIRKVTLYQSFVKYIRAGCAEVENIKLLERFGELVARSGVKTAVDLSVNPLISSPLLIGFFRPHIVLPTTELPDSDFQFTILHELTHFKRRDMFYKWLMQAAICLHWFNPFAYLMGREVECACELACDEAVIRNLDTAGRRAYGDTLINAVGAGGHYKDTTVAAVTLFEGTKELQERLNAITGFQKKPKIICALSLVLTGAICLGAVSVGAYSAPVPGEKPMISGDLKLMTLEFTIEELIAEDVNSVGLDVLDEEITVARGGDTLKIEYYAANPEEYFSVRTRDVYPEAPDNYIFLYAAPNQRQTAAGNRTISVTVPEDYPIKYISIRTTTGNVHVNDCGFAGSNISTKTGKIDFMALPDGIPT